MYSRGLEDLHLTITSMFQKKSLEEGRQIHAHMKNNGIYPDLILGTTLINMYISCGSLQESREVFDKLQDPDRLTWNMMILAYGKSGCPEEAFELFIQMEQRGVKPNEFTLVGILSAATNALDMYKGIWIHEYMIKFDIEPNVYVNNALIDMYVKCGSMHDANHVFDGMNERDVVSWNTMISGWTRHSNPKKAIALFRGMISEGFKPTDITFLSLMNACACIGDLNLAKEIHSQIHRYGISMKQSLNNTLIDMFCKCEGLKDGVEWFSSLAVRDEVSWNAIIGGHCHNGHFSDVLELFKKMMDEGSMPNEITFLSVFNACAELGKLNVLRTAHACVNKTLAQFNIFICTALVDAYSKCQSLEDARTIFNKSAKDNVVLCTTMIAGYNKNNQGEQALRLFHEMGVRGIRVNVITFVNILDTCTTLLRLEDGQIMHCYIVETGITLNICLENAMIDLYAKCGSLTDATWVFDSMGEHDLVSWTALISGYASLKQFENVFHVFEKMMEKGVEPDEVAYVTMNNACANLAVIEQGRVVHTSVVESDILMDAFIGNSLIDMYAKCGSLKDAFYVLNRLYERDVISWNTLLSACAQHGQGNQVLIVVRRMEDDGMILNDISFLCILSVFGRLGMIDEGFVLLHYMLSLCFHIPTAEHYTCIIDLLGRIGHFSEAQAFVERMPFQPSAIVWGSLLGACKLHGFMNLGEYAAEEMLQLEPENPAILMQECCTDGTLSKDEFRSSCMYLVQAWNKYFGDQPSWRWHDCPDYPVMGEGYLVLEDMSLDNKQFSSPEESSSCFRDIDNEVYEDIVDPETVAPSLNQCHVYSYHIVYSDIFKVPKLFLKGRNSDGCPLQWQDIQQDLPVCLSNESSTWTFLTHEEHPYLHMPWLALHPCGTSKLMRTVLSVDGIASRPQSMALAEDNETSTICKKHSSSAHVTDAYMLSWLSFVSQAVGLKLPGRYSLLFGDLLTRKVSV